jgi:hypothetical protein
MYEVVSENRGPRSDFGSCLDKDVVVRLRHSEYAQQSGLADTCAGRLVGVDRFGLWIEPGAQRQVALNENRGVEHYFVPWSEVLTVIRTHEANKFEVKKEYRGLRPS